MAEPILVVLAGGEGKRLAPVFDRPKILLEFGGRCLVEWTLDAFAEAGGQEAVLVTGWKSKVVERRLGDEYNGVSIHYVVNRFYKETGAGYGLLLARAKWAGKPCIIMEGDQLLHPFIVWELMEGPEDCLPAKAGRPELVEETVVVGSRGKVDRLVWPASNVGGDDPVVGEAIVMIKLSAENSRRLVNYLGMGEIIEPLNALDLHYFATGLPWIEIDTPEDLERAKEIHRRIEEHL
jgi:choline kinase